MMRTNVFAQRGSVFLALLFFLNCEATTRQSAVTPVEQVVAVEYAAYAPPSVITTESTPASASAVMTDQEAYDDAPLNESVDSADAEPSSPEPIRVMHYAEVRGRIESHKGTRLTIEPLVATSATLPIPGSRANLWVESTDEDGTSDWKHFAEVKMAGSLEFGMSMEVDIVNNSNKRARAPLPQGSRVRVQFEW